MRMIVIALSSMTSVAFGQAPLVGQQLRVSLDATSKSASETTAAASADGQEIVAGFVDFRTDGTIKNSFSLSSDGGQTWNHVVLRPPSGLEDNLEADPLTAYDPRTNTLFAGGISRAKCLYVARKLQGQNAFGPSIAARLSDWPDKGWMAAGPKYNLPLTTRLYLAYNEGIIWSDDLGQTWSPPLSLGTGYGFLPRVGPLGQLYLTYWDGYWGIMFRKSLDNGLTWSAAFQPATRLSAWGVQNYGIPGKFRNFTNNAMAVNPVDGSIVILYFDQTNIVNGQKNLDLYMVRSSDQGVTWTPAERLPFRPLGQVSDMIFPWVEYTKDGRLHLMAMDTSYNPGQVDGENPGLWDQVYFYSDDNGTTWSPKIRLTPTSWDSSLDGTGGALFLGDYQGMAASRKTVYPLYPDTRLNGADAYVNRIHNLIEQPSGYVWAAGTGLSGTLSDLFRRDGSSVVASPKWILNYGETAQLEASFSIPGPSPSSVQVCVWASATQPNLQQRIEAFDPNLGQWILIDMRPSSVTASQTLATVASPSNYLVGGQMKVRVILKSVLRRPTRAWTAIVDQCVLLTEP